MDNHEKAIMTHKILEKRKKDKALKRKLDIAWTGWNGYTKVITKRAKRYYNRRHTV